MIALRITRPSDRGLWVCVAALVLPVGFCGCGTPTPPGSRPDPHAVGTYDPAWMPGRHELPPPDAERINYDARSRTLTLYELSGNDRWEIRLPGEVTGRPVPPQHRLPDVDMSEVYVYYTRPGVKSSSSVSIKKILDSGNAHVSLAR